MSKNLINYNNLNLSTDLDFSESKSIGNGKIQTKMVYLNINNSPVMIQTPKMRTPFGMSKYEMDQGNTKYTLNLSLQGMDVDKTKKEFFEFILKFEEHVKEYVKKNSVALLKKKHLSDDMCNEIFSSSIKYSKNRNYAPTFHLKLPYFNNKFGFAAFDNNYEDIADFNESTISKSTEMVTVIKSNGIWCGSNGFGCTWKIVQLKICESEKRDVDDKKFAFLDDE